MPVLSDGTRVRQNGAVVAIATALIVGAVAASPVGAATKPVKPAYAGNSSKAAKCYVNPRACRRLR